MYYMYSIFYAQLSLYNYAHSIVHIVTPFFGEINGPIYIYIYVPIEEG